MTDDRNGIWIHETLQPTNLSESLTGMHTATGLPSNCVTKGLVKGKCSLLLGSLLSDLQCLDWFTVKRGIVEVTSAWFAVFLRWFAVIDCVRQATDTLMCKFKHLVIFDCKNNRKSLGCGFRHSSLLILICRKRGRGYWPLSGVACILCLLHPSTVGWDWGYYFWEILFPGLF